MSTPKKKEGALEACGLLPHMVKSIRYTETPCPTEEFAGR